MWAAGTGAKATNLRGAPSATRPAVCEQVCASALPPFPPQFSFVVVLLWEMQLWGGSRRVRRSDGRVKGSGARLGG